MKLQLVVSIFFPGDKTKLKHLLFDANLTMKAAAKEWKTK